MRGGGGLVKLTDIFLVVVKGRVGIATRWGLLCDTIQLLQEVKAALRSLDLLLRRWGTE